MSVVWLMVSNLWIFSMIFVGRETTDKYSTPYNDTVDGRNPAPADMVNIPFFTGFYASPGGCLGFLPSRVCLCTIWKKNIYFPIGSFYPNNGFYWRFPEIRALEWLACKVVPWKMRRRDLVGQSTIRSTWIFLICFFCPVRIIMVGTSNETKHIIYIYICWCFNIKWLGFKHVVLPCLFKNISRTISG